MGTCKEQLTHNQLATLEKLNLKGDDLTTKQKTERTRLQKKKDNPPRFDLSEGAKTYIRSLVKKDIYKYHIQLENKYLKKGIMCEDDSINLHNEVFFTRYVKNEVRMVNEFISGECDVITPNKIQDYKTSWSKDSFPELPEDIEVGGYEWQGRGYMYLYNRYMYLYNRPFFELVYCLVDTPDELLDFETNFTPHHVEDIAPELRITKLLFERDFKKESLIEYKIKECRKYANYRKQQILNK
jgi:hypothetical protein